MTRPKALKEIDLTPFKTIETDIFQKAYVGKVDEKGRIPSVGTEFVNMEVYVFVKKVISNE